MLLNTQAGWRLEVLPWVVGERGVSDVAGTTWGPLAKEAGSVDGISCCVCQGFGVSSSGAALGKPQSILFGLGLSFNVNRSKRRKRGKAAESSGMTWQFLSRDPNHKKFDTNLRIFFISKKRTLYEREGN